MRALRNVAFITALATAALAAATPAAAQRTVGQVIDDTVITTEIKAKLAADKLSNLTKVDVKTQNGIVTMNGVVDDAERRMRAAQIASSVDGVKGIVNNLHVAGSTVGSQPVTTAPQPVATGSVPPTTTSVPGTAVDATGVVAQVDQATGTVTLQDGRVLRLTNQTVVWQPGTIQGLRPGSQVYVRGATPVDVKPAASVPAPTTPEWRMGTVRSVDRATGTIALTDGTLIRVSPSATVRRGSDRLAVDQIVPGSEVVVRTAPGTGEGSALPGRVPGTTTLEASEINIVWTPVGSLR